MRNETIALTIKGKPIAKKRPRFARRGKFVATYNDQETEEGRFLWEVKQQYKGEPFVGAVELLCDFRMYIPKGTSKKKQAQMLSNKIQHTKKPDLDNLIKFVKDCLNGVCWVDDSQVVRIEAVKRYGAVPATLIIISKEWGR